MAKNTNTTTDASPTTDDIIFIVRIIRVIFRMVSSYLFCMVEIMVNFIVLQTYFGR